jgi:hypothetical protein
MSIDLRKRIRAQILRLDVKIAFLQEQLKDAKASKLRLSTRLNSSRASSLLSRSRSRRFY